MTGPAGINILLIPVFSIFFSIFFSPPRINRLTLQSAKRQLSRLGSLISSQLLRTHRPWLCSISKDLAPIPLDALPAPCELNSKDTRTLSWQQFHLQRVQALPSYRLPCLLDTTRANKERHQCGTDPAASVIPILPGVPTAPRPFAKSGKSSRSCWE